MSSQTYETHRRFVPAYHYVLASLVLLAFLASGWNVVRAVQRGSGRFESALVAVLSVAIVLIVWFTREFPLKAQDRAIRAEENLRHYVLTGKLLDPRLTIRQVIGLRFAADAEFVELARRAAEEGLSEDAIKRAVKNWRADDHRM
jgi:hypothetical protein